jgi:deoxyribodipyrimidine photo-lyase
LRDDDPAVAFHPMSQSTFPFPRQAATRAEALAQLEAFAKRAHRYARERNFVVDAHRNVSQLSAAMQHRLISQEEVVQQVLSLHPFPAVEKFLQEVLWRSYWKGWLEWRPSVWQDYLSQLSGFSEEDRQRAQSVAQGQSGCAVMDDFAQELRETGYLHNHARMWWASFWIHHQKLPWALGAEFFLQHLLDADAASNTLSWRWVAGLQTAGKTYLVRRDNIERYHHAPPRKGLEMLDSITVSTPPEELAHERIESLDLTTALPSPQRKTLILLHEEDLSIEQTTLAKLQPERIVFFDRTASNPPSPRQQWRQAAFQDAIARVGSHFQKRCDVVQDLRDIHPLIAERSIEQIVMMKPMVGPLDDALRPFLQELSTAQIDIHALRREEDARYFPLARSGFFPFWKKVGQQLAQR